MKKEAFGSSFKKDRSPGEPMVWFSGMWLAIGMLMILVLLWVILANGVSVFWPKRVVEVVLKPNAESAIRGATTLAGEIRKEQKKAIGGIDAITETQFFVGNRDAYGFGFQFVNDSDILERRLPEDHHRRGTGGIRRSDRISGENRNRRG